MDMHFKTSHVIVYHSVCGIVYSGKENFKTSHVIVYLEFRDRFLCKIHYFKTSHVIVYRSICRFLRIRLCNFKTSHVIVYQQQIYDYIAVEANFKTSHVIVYLCFLVLQFLLSSTFQNISCYCLSETECAACRHKVISKHLMLLFIWARYTGRKYYWYFKTSHVIVYQSSQTGWFTYSNISKHLMLLFINPRRCPGMDVLRFQNISCYCLSALHFYTFCELLYFKTSHVIVYH